MTDPKTQQEKEERERKEREERANVIHRADGITVVILDSVSSWDEHILSNSFGNLKTHSKKVVGKW